MNLTDPGFGGLGGGGIAATAAQPAVKRLIHLPLHTRQVDAIADEDARLVLRITSWRFLNNFAGVVGVTDVGNIIARDIDGGLLHAKGR